MVTGWTYDQVRDMSWPDFINFWCHLSDNPPIHETIWAIAQSAFGMSCKDPLMNDKPLEQLARDLPGVVISWNKKKVA